MNHELKVGDRIKDNDPRMNGRVVQITRISGLCAFYDRRPFGSEREYSVRLTRIHTDGKPRKSGFSLITPEAP